MGMHHITVTTLIFVNIKQINKTQFITCFNVSRFKQSAYVEQK